MEIEQLKSRGFEKEFVFNASRSSGAGGQNVNKVNTKIELRFNVNSSEILLDSEKELLFSRLGSQLTNEGELLIVAQSARSQIQNKEISIEKFYKTISKALTVRKKRKPTAPSKASREKRLDLKRKRAEKKDLRKKPE